MDRINYAGDTFLTGTAIARALLEYARILAEQDSSDTVEIPVVSESGEPATSALLIGPASQIVSTTESTDLEDIVDDALVADLAERCARVRLIGSPAPRAVTDADDPADLLPEIDV